MSRSADDRRGRDGEQEIVALQLVTHRVDAVEVGPVQQREPHRADAELVQGEGEGGFAPGQQFDAVAPEQRHVTFPQPQHGVDPEPGSALGVVGRGWAWTTSTLLILPPASSAAVRVGSRSLSLCPYWPKSQRLLSNEPYLVIGRPASPPLARNRRR